MLPSTTATRDSPTGGGPLRVATEPPVPIRPPDGDGVPARRTGEHVFSIGPHDPPARRFRPR